jgi:hypothetical protein
MEASGIDGGSAFIRRLWAAIPRLAELVILCPAISREGVSGLFGVWVERGRRTRIWDFGLVLLGAMGYVGAMVGFIITHLPPALRM